MADIVVQLKTCEACGRSFTRPAQSDIAYCDSCTAMFTTFPSPLTRKRRGRPSKKRNNVVQFAIDDVPTIDVDIEFPSGTFCIAASVEGDDGSNDF